MIVADDVPATQGAVSKSTDQELGEEQLNTVLGGLDKCVGSIIEALPVNGLLVVFTCQGDTAEYRRMQVSLPQSFDVSLQHLHVQQEVGIVRALFYLQYVVPSVWVAHSSPGSEFTYSMVSKQNKL